MAPEPTTAPAPSTGTDPGFLPPTPSATPSGTPSGSPDADRRTVATSSSSPSHATLLALVGLGALLLIVLGGVAGWRRVGHAAPPRGRHRG